MDVLRRNTESESGSSVQARFKAGSRDYFFAPFPRKRESREASVLLLGRRFRGEDEMGWQEFPASQDG